MNKILQFVAFFCLLFVFSNASAQTEMLTGGNLEDSTAWHISLLNTAAGMEPSAEWNYTTDAPTAGAGGNLHVTGSTTSGNSQYCIYQAVHLTANKVYTFDGAFKALAINNSWCEVFIGIKPIDGNDYGTAEGTRLAAFGTWAGYTSDDGVFSKDIDPANYKTFTADTSGQYYFILKMGSTSWDGSTQQFDILVDELTLTESDPVAVNKLKAGGVIAGGDMVDSTLWNISFLNTPVASQPLASWNNTDHTPAAGDGGCLYIPIQAPADQAQYAIYQKVNLSKDSAYFFNGAYKYSGLNNAWCEVFIGSQPVDGNDYGGGQFKLVAFSAWSVPAQQDGTFKEDGIGYQYFVPDHSGDYYFVLKAGCLAGGEISIAVDQLSLKGERLKPVPDFSADVVSGFAPLQVQFTDKSSLATSWLWDFGDGMTSNEQNPTHTYNNAGTYSVSLTATNEIGDSSLVKNDYITVNPPLKLSAGGVITGGNMADSAQWGISNLNTPSGSEAVAKWNEMTNVPSAGQDGALYVSGQANNSTVQYAIYQKVTLSKDSIYEFNAAVKDFTTNLNQAWLEVYIGPQPTDGLDYSKDDPANFLLSEFSTWSNECNPKGVDGTFALNSCGINGFIPSQDSDYYFVLKMGSTSWAGDDMPFSLAIDELSLTGKRVKPIVAFEADKPLGFAPLSVQFTDQSYFGNSWAWDFGDGNTSTEQNPVHVYDAVGVYDVTLTVTNELGSTVLTKTQYIKANQKPDLPPGEMLYGGNMEDPNLWNISTLNTTDTTEALWNNTDDTLAYGKGGNLQLSASVQNSQSQYCIWQPVNLKAGMKYTFNGAFRDLSTNLDHFWSEVYVGTTPPKDGADYGDGQTKIAFFNTWDCGHAPGLNGTYQDNACGDSPVGVFVPDSTATYYFALKTGNIDWENKVFSFTILIDELSLKESKNVPPPEADFFSDVTTGDAPLTVNFTNLSKNATEYLWEFGDDSTSTVESPSHTYSKAGVYSVKLIAYNAEGASDTLLVDSLITVSSPTGIQEMVDHRLHAYPNPSTGIVTFKVSGLKIDAISITDMAGRTIHPSISQMNGGVFNIKFKQQGFYLVRFSTPEKVIVKRVLIRK
jgi:PKD repeat protein